MCSFFAAFFFTQEDTMSDEQRRHPRDRRIGRQLLVTQREMLLAQLLLSVADRVAREDEDQEFTELYNACKLFAEGRLR